jgi:hypothetical protein
VTRGAPRAALRQEAGAAPGAAPSRSIVGCFWCFLLSRLAPPRTIGF